MWPQVHQVELILHRSRNHWCSRTLALAPSLALTRARVGKTVGAGICDSLLGYSHLGSAKSKAWDKIVYVRGDPKKQEWESRQSDTGRRNNEYRAGKGRLSPGPSEMHTKSLPGRPPVARGGSLYLSTSSWPPSVEGCLQGCWRRRSGCICPCPPGSSVSGKLQGRRGKALLSALEREKPELAQNSALKLGSVRGGQGVFLGAPDMIVTPPSSICS